jgi:hypothetical protein
VTIPLNGVETEIVICSGGVVIGRCYHSFQDAPSGGQVSAYFETEQFPAI